LTAYIISASSAIKSYFYRRTLIFYSNVTPVDSLKVSPMPSQRASALNFLC